MFKQYFFHSRVKKEHAAYVKKKFSTGGGPPPSPPDYDGLEEAAVAMESELLPMEGACDSLTFPASQKQQLPLIVDVKHVGKSPLFLYTISIENNLSIEFGLYTSILYYNVCSFN